MNRIKLHKHYIFAYTGMKTYQLYWFIWIMAIISPPLLAAELVVLPVNTLHSLPLTASASLYVEKRNFLQLQDKGNTLWLIGKKEGSTLLQIGPKSYKIIITNEGMIKSYQRLQSVIALSPSLELDYSHDGNWIIKGHLDHISTWLSLALQKTISFQALFEVTSEQLQMMEYQINKTLLRESLYPITLRLEPIPTVRLSPSSLGKNFRIHDVLKSFGVMIKDDVQQLSYEPLIRVNVLLVELRKSFSQSLGIEWPTEVTAKAIPATSLPLEGGPTAIARFLSTQGNGKILANPILLTKSGSDADFFAGGEFPVRVKTRQTYSISWKKYGIALKIKPLADNDGKISLDLNSEISSLDSGQNLEGIPALFSNSLSSHFDLQSSQTIALSGLTKKINGESLKQWPGLGDIPILGSLFTSKEYLEDQTELVVFVTPSIVPQGE